MPGKKGQITEKVEGTFVFSDIHCTVLLYSGKFLQGSNFRYSQCFGNCEN